VPKQWKHEASYSTRQTLDSTPGPGQYDSFSKTKGKLEGKAVSIL
jgi:hypothetical protein